MRGFPPIQIFLLALAFGLLAVPLVQLTSGVVEATPVVQIDSVPNAKTEDVPTLIRLRYAHKPLSVSLKQAGVELLGQVDLSETANETKTKLTISKAGDDLELEASWPTGTPETALTLEIEPDARELRTRTCWSTEAALHEILTFIW